MSEKGKLEVIWESRRDFVKKAVYVPPAILTLQAAPAYAKYGSEKPKDSDWYEDKDKKPKSDDKKNKDK